MTTPATPETAAAISRRDRWWWRGGLLAALLLGGALRWPAVFAAYPYLTYVDEGHLLQPVRQTLATGRWDPAANNYPQLPVRTIAAASRLLSPLAPYWRYAPPVSQARPAMRYYNQVEPPQLIVAGRLVSFLLGCSIIVLAGALGRRLTGDLGGAVAALAAALLPALVLRGAAVTVDPYATAFVLGALLAAPTHDGRWRTPRATLAGAFCGCAAISKYPAGLALVAVGILLFSLPGTAWRARIRDLLAAAAGAAGAVAILMPATWREPARVWQRIVWQGSIYSTKSSDTLWQQTFRRAEWDLPQVGTAELGFVFVAVAAAGFAVLLVRPRTRFFGAASLVFIAVLVFLHSRYAFQAFRNLLPAAALACVAFGAAAAGLGERLRRPRAVAAGAALVLCLLFLPAALRFAQERSALVDSRHQAIEWLRENRAGGQLVLVAAEAAIPPLDVERLGDGVATAAWPEWRRRLRETRPRFLLTADLQVGDRPLVPGQDRRWILRRYRVRVTFGTAASQSAPFAWRGNRLRTWILERRPPAPGDSSPHARRAG